MFNDSHAFVLPDLFMTIVFDKRLEERARTALEEDEGIDKPIEHP